MAVKRIIQVVPSKGMHIAMCGRGANQHADVILRKSADPAPPSSTEPTDMKFEHMKTLLGLDEKSKSYFLTLDEAAGTAFLEKAADAQAADVTKWVAEVEKAKKPGMGDDNDEDDKKKAADQAAAAAAAAANVNKTADQIEIGRLKAVIEEQGQAIKSIQEGAGNSALVLKAKGFVGYPGGETVVVERLKAISGLPEDVRKGIESDMLLKCQTGMAASIEAGIVALKTLDGSASNTIKKRAEEISKAQNISKEAAYGEAISGDLLMKALAEEDGVSGG